MTCTYEFLEDTFTDWGPGLYDCMELPASQTGLNSNNFCARQKQSKLTRLGQKLKLPGYARKHSELKENHPFKFMVMQHLICLGKPPLYRIGSLSISSPLVANVHILYPLKTPDSNSFFCYYFDLTVTFYCNRNVKAQFGLFANMFFLFHLGSK